MPYCVFRKCKNYGSKIKKDEGVTYHTFPSDVLTAHKWICIVRTDRCEHDWTPSKCSTICSAHFKEEDKYKTTKGYVRLKTTALPVVLLTDQGDPLTDQDQPLTDQDHPVTHQENEDNESITSSISIGSALDTALEAHLKRQLEKCRSKLTETRKKFRNLQCKNKKLVRKNAAYKAALNILKDKIESLEDELSKKE